MLEGKLHYATAFMKCVVIPLKETTIIFVINARVYQNTRRDSIVFCGKSARKLLTKSVLKMPINMPIYKGRLLCLKRVV